MFWKDLNSRLYSSLANNLVDDTLLWLKYDLLLLFYRRKASTPPSVGKNICFQYMPRAYWEWIAFLNVHYHPIWSSWSELVSDIHFTTAVTSRLLTYHYYTRCTKPQLQHHSYSTILITLQLLHYSYYTTPITLQLLHNTYYTTAAISHFL